MKVVCLTRSKNFEMLGITQEFKPRFLRQYANLDEVITNAVSQYIKDVKSEDFPNDQEQY